MNSPSTEPARVRAEGSVIVVDGSAGIVLPLFPAAVITSGETLREVGTTAYGQVGADPLTCRNFA